ncbi:hypothetical protein LOAG_13213, partial [Loa loa]
HGPDPLPYLYSFAFLPPSNKPRYTRLREQSDADLGDGKQGWRKDSKTFRNAGITAVVAVAVAWWLVSWLVGWLVDRSVGRLVGWLVGWLNRRRTNRRGREDGGRGDIGRRNEVKRRLFGNEELNRTRCVSYGCVGPSVC